MSFLKPIIKALRAQLHNLKADFGELVTVAQSASATLIGNSDVRLAWKMRNIYRFECYDKNGNLKWIEEVPNMVMDAGINDLLDKYFKGSSYTAAFSVGMVDNAGFSAYAAGDTMSSHSGWSESTAYSNATRPTLTLGTVASKSVDNSASKAVFNINATATINGAFVTTSSTKGGTTGTLYGAAAFTGGNRSVQSGDTLNVTVTLSGS